MNDLDQALSGAEVERVSAQEQIRQLAARVAELEKEVADHRRDGVLQRALYEIAALSAADAPEHLHYVRLHEIVGRLMYAKNFIIASYDPEQQMIRQEYLVDEDPNRSQGSFAYGEGISSLVIRSRRALAARRRTVPVVWWIAAKSAPRAA